MAAKSKFEDTISGLSSTQLEDYIIGYARKDRSFAGKFAEYVKSRLLDDDDTGVRREVAGLFFLECPIRRYDDDTDWYGIMGGINDLFDRAYEALGKGQIRKASGVALAWLDGLAGSFEEYEYDENGEQALMEQKANYEVKALFVQEGKLVVAIKETELQDDSAWMKEYEKETGEEVSFF